ncbi:hypothetical protein [Clostridium tarantellae]|uniref:Uncharacterized protein n=1 Tax=Clostridium tarantellae TaxID=39493 RepID=A0A6I1MLX2_9CLOT|nr:hypothetical protein [Clostridium tarantellae]MPQ44004.1 hypothetical protein [Clostridium tarantellae]
MNRSVGVNTNKEYKYILNKMKRYDTCKYHSKFSNNESKDKINDFLFKIYDLKDDMNKNIKINNVVQKFKDGLYDFSKKHEIRKSLSKNCNCLKEKCLTMDKKLITAITLGITVGVLGYATIKFIKS